jgi:hypothetical protein
MWPESIEARPPRNGAIVLYLFGYFSTISQSGPPMTFDRAGVEPEFLYTAHNQLLRVVRENRIDQNDPFTRRESPCRMDLATDKIEILAGSAYHVLRGGALAEVETYAGSAEA